MRTATLIYIAGEAHSGSTAADFLLGRIAGRSCGQIAELGDLVDARGEILAATLTRTDLGGWLHFVQDLPQSERADHRWMREEIRNERKVGRYLMSRRARAAFARAFDRTLPSLLAYCGSPMLIDSSKNATRALGLHASGSCNVFVLHLIRRPADFLVSLTKREQARGLAAQLFWLAHWMMKNFLAHLLGRFYRERYILLRYHMLFSDPYRALAPLLARLDVSISEEEFSRTMADVRMPPETIGGNRIRTQGPLRLEVKNVPDEDLRAIHPIVRTLCRVVESATMPEHA